MISAFGYYLNTLVTAIAVFLLWGFTGIIELTIPAIILWLGATVERIKA